MKPMTKEIRVMPGLQVLSVSQRKGTLNFQKSAILRVLLFKIWLWLYFLKNKFICIYLAVPESWHVNLVAACGI